MSWWKGGGGGCFVVSFLSNVYMLIKCIVGSEGARWVEKSWREVFIFSNQSLFIVCHLLVVLVRRRGGGGADLDWLYVFCIFLCCNEMHGRVCLNFYLRIVLIIVLNLDKRQLFILCCCCILCCETWFWIVLTLLWILINSYEGRGVEGGS